MCSRSYKGDNSKADEDLGIKVRLKNVKCVFGNRYTRDINGHLLKSRFPVIKHNSMDSMDSTTPKLETNYK